MSDDLDLLEEVLEDELENEDEPRAEAEEAEEAAASKGFEDIADVTQIYLNDIGSNALLTPAQEIELARSTDDEKQSQIQRLRDFQTRNADQAPAMLARLMQTVIDNGNVFAVS